MTSGNQFDDKGLHNLERRRISRRRQIGGYTSMMGMDHRRGVRGERHQYRRSLVSRLRQSWGLRFWNWVKSLVGFEKGTLSVIQQRESRRAERSYGKTFAPRQRATVQRLFTPVKAMGFLFAVMALSGCQKAMNREQVIAACRQCEEAKMASRYLTNGLTNEIVDVQCWPKKADQ